MDFLDVDIARLREASREFRHLSRGLSKESTLRGRVLPQRSRPKSTPLSPPQSAASLALENDCNLSVCKSPHRGRIRPNQMQISEYEDRNDLEQCQDGSEGHLDLARINIPHGHEDRIQRPASAGLHRYDKRLQRPSTAGCISVNTVSSAFIQERKERMISEQVEFENQILEEAVKQRKTLNDRVDMGNRLSEWLGKSTRYACLDRQEELENPQRLGNLYVKSFNIVGPAAVQGRSCILPVDIFQHELDRLRLEVQRSRQRENVATSKEGAKQGETQLQSKRGLYKQNIERNEEKDEDEEARQDRVGNQQARLREILDGTVNETREIEDQIADICLRGWNMLI